jgi:hypothetical protein
MSSIAESIAFAAPSFTGRLLRPTDPEYDDVRRVHNGLIDKRPAIIARCHGAADVVDAVLLARTSTACSMRVTGFNVVIASSGRMHVRQNEASGGHARPLRP